MSKGEAMKYVFTFGKHRDKTLGEVYLEEPEYLDWCRDVLEENRYPKLFEALEIIYEGA